MDGFSNWDREEPFEPFTVMLFKGLQVVAFMFFLAYLAINTDAKQGKVADKERQHGIGAPVFEANGAVTLTDHIETIRGGLTISLVRASPSGHRSRYRPLRRAAIGRYHRLRP